MLENVLIGITARILSIIVFMITLIIMWVIVSLFKKDFSLKGLDASIEEGPNLKFFIQAFFYVSAVLLFFMITFSVVAFCAYKLTY